MTKRLEYAVFYLIMSTPPPPQKKKKKKEKKRMHPVTNYYKESLIVLSFLGSHCPVYGAFDLSLAVSVPLPIVTGIFVLLWFQSRLT